jgi:hypothetical protein
MTFPNPKWLPGVSEVLDAAAAVDKGGGFVGLPITGHGFQAGQTVTITGTVNYDAAYPIISQTANEIVITATYVAENFAGTETAISGKEVILKGDFRDLEDAIQNQGAVRMQPPLVWITGGASVRVEATADCVAAMQFTGMPNILNPQVQVHGGLSDGKIRTVTGNVTCDLATPADLWGLEKVSQWYAVFAIAEDADTDFALKAMPIMRVCSQASPVISLGTLADPSIGRRYGFNTDELVGGQVYFLTGDSRGLMRAITANDNATGTDGTSGTITYGGVGLSMAANDWFIVLPPTNFRLVGTFFNNSSGNIVQFRRLGNVVNWLELISCTVPSATVVEDIRIACPFATGARAFLKRDTPLAHVIGHPSATGDATASHGVSAATPITSITMEFNLEFCRYYGDTSLICAVAYSYPPGCGF